MGVSFDRKRQEASHKSTMVSVVVNIALTILQFLIGLFAQSTALVADALHSLSDLLSDGIVLVVNRHSHQPADMEHPYGHHRFETAASTFIGVILLAVGASMVWTGITKLQDPSSIPKVHSIALVVALFAIVSKELLYRYLMRVAKQVNSTMLAANAWHARSDAASSVVVAIGILANLSGFPLADPLAALIVGLIIIRMGWSFFYESFHDLLDRSADEETCARIEQHLLDTPGVLGLHDLRTRKMGDKLWIEVDLEMDGSLTIVEGHAIAVEAQQRVKRNERDVLDVMTHFDPVDPKTLRHLAGETAALKSNQNHE